MKRTLYATLVERHKVGGGKAILVSPKPFRIHKTEEVCFREWYEAGIDVDPAHEICFFGWEALGLTLPPRWPWYTKVEVRVKD